MAVLNFLFGRRQDAIVVCPGGALRGFGRFIASRTTRIPSFSRPSWLHPDSIWTGHVPADHEFLTVVDTELTHAPVGFPDW